MKRKPSAPRAAVHWLLLLALLAGTLGLHGEATSHSAGVGPLGGEESLYLCAEGHAPGSHVERPRLAEHDDCAACLHRLQVRGADPSPSALPADSASGGPTPAEPPGPVAIPVLDHAPSRGPPAV